MKFNETSIIRDEDRIDEATLPELTQLVNSRPKRNALVESDADVSKSHPGCLSSPDGANHREG